MPKFREVVLDTSAGRLAGRAFGRGFAFKGIPYGEAPEGELRFRPPVMRAPWRGIRKAAVPGSICHQCNEDYPAWRDATPAGEDCLVANVWTPTLASAANLPVMIWIHGGAFANGSAGLAMYDGGRLSEAENVVVVSINHRLNIFGYLYLGGLSTAYTDSANLGQQDIVLALQWVKRTISVFGGDPARVTLFGESGGGAKIAALMSMPAARGLFSRAIVQSGWLLNMLSAGEAAQRAELVRRTLGLSKKYIERLRFLPAAMLHDAGTQLLTRFGSGVFFPVADGTIIPDNPWAGGREYPGERTALLVGTTADEGAYFIPEAMHGLPIRRDADLCRAIARLCDPLHLTVAQARLLVQRYRGSISGHASRNRCLIDILTSVLFLGNAVSLADRQSQRGNVFMYRFDWTFPCWGGRYSPHAAEVPFVFGTLDYAKAAFGAGDLRRRRAAADPAGERFALARRIQKAWASFARSGNPSNEDLPEWAGYEETRRATMILDRRCRVENDPSESARGIAMDLNLPARKLRSVTASAAHAAAALAE